MNPLDNTALRGHRPSTYSHPAIHQGTFSDGEILADRFEVLHFLARGGMGEVYAARDLELDEAVAIKIVRPNHTAPEVLAHFRREVRLARRVTHPSVCRVHDLFHHHETPDKASHQALLLISMELLEGETLESVLRRRGRLTTTAAAPIIGQILAGLCAAHTQGIIHRDLKSSNVILTSSPKGERVVVTDFGLAQLQDLSDDQTIPSEPGMMVGTPSYMAPEQVRGDSTGPQTDLYALGVLMFEMVTGQLPFPGESRQWVLAQRLWQEAPDPASLVPDLDPTWRRAIQRCLAMCPTDRLGSCDELAEYLGLAELPGSGLAEPLGFGLEGGGSKGSGSQRPTVSHRGRWITTMIVALVLGLGLATDSRDVNHPSGGGVTDQGIHSSVPSRCWSASSTHWYTKARNSGVANGKALGCCAGHSVSAP